MDFSDDDDVIADIDFDAIERRNDEAALEGSAAKRRRVDDADLSTTSWNPTLDENASPPAQDTNQRRSPQTVEANHKCLTRSLSPSLPHSMIISRCSSLPNYSLPSDLFPLHRLDPQPPLESDSEAALFGLLISSATALTEHRLRFFARFFLWLPSLFRAPGIADDAVENPHRRSKSPWDPRMRTLSERAGVVLEGLDFVSASLRRLLTEDGATHSATDAASNDWSESAVRDLLNFSRRLLLTMRLRVRPFLGRDDSSRPSRTEHSIFLLHLHFLILWRLLDIVSILSAKYRRFGPGFDLLDERHELALRDQYLYVLIADSLFLVGETSSSSSSSSWPCSCFASLWRSLSLSSSSLSDSSLGLRSSTSLLSKFIDAVVRDNNNNNDDDLTVESVNRVSDVESGRRLSSAQRLVLAWTAWIRVAEWRTEASPGDPDAQCAAVDLIRRILNESPTAVDLVELLESVLRLGRQWGETFETLSVLWEFFHREFNSDFGGGDVAADFIGVARGMTKPDSPLEALERVRRALQMQTEVVGAVDEIQVVGVRRRNPFLLFLRLLGATLESTRQMAGETVAQKKWKSFKGKIYTKFHPRRVKELNLAGFENLVDLFVALIVVDGGDGAEYAKRFVETVKPVVDSLDAEKMEIVVRGQMALLLWRRPDVFYATSPSSLAWKQELVASLSTTMDNRCREYACGFNRSSPSNAKLTNSFDAKKRSAWRTIRNFCRWTGESLGERSLEGHVARRLLCPALLRLLGEKATPHETSTVLEAYSAGVDNLVAELKAQVTTTRPPSDPLSDLAWRELCPRLLKWAVAGVSPDLSGSTSRLSMSLACLARVSPPSSPVVVAEAGIELRVQNSNDLVQFFVGDKRTSLSLVAAFWTRLEEVDEGLLGIECSAGKMRDALMSAWFRFAVVTPPLSPSSSDLKRLTRILFARHELVRLICSDSASNLEFFTASSFLAAVGGSFHPEAASVLVSLAREFVQWTVTLLKGHDPSTISLVYKAAHLFLVHCGAALFNQSDPHCLFVGVVNRFLLPRSFLAGNAPLLLQPVRDHLPLFLSAIGAQLARAGGGAKFLENKVKEIVFWHLHKLHDEAKGIDAHPLLTALFTTTTAPRSSLDRIEELIVAHISKTWFSKNNSDLFERLAPPVSPLLPLSFFLRLLRRHRAAVVDPPTPTGAASVRRFVRVSLGALPGLLDAHFQRLTSAEEALVGEAIETIVRATRDSGFCRAVDRDIFAADVASILTAFVSGPKFGNSNHAALRALERVTGAGPELGGAVVACVARRVEAVERARGVGLDPAMRRRVAAWAEKLGAAGREEAKRLRTF